MKNQKPQVAALIINWNGMAIKYNGKPILKTCIDSLLKDPYPNLKIVMIDGSSQDTSIRFVNKHYPQIATCIVEDKGTGSLFNDGMKFAFKKCPKAKYIAFVCNDLTFNEPCITKMVAAAERDEKISMVDCRLFYPDGRVQYGGVNMSAVGPYAETNPKKASISRYVKNGMACTIFILLRASMIREFGFFDKALQPTFLWEDNDFTMRLHKAGHKIYYLGNTNVTHLEAYTIKSTAVTKKWTKEERFALSRTTGYIFYLRHARHLFLQFLVSDTIGNFVGIGAPGHRKITLRNDIGLRVRTQPGALWRAIKDYKKTDTRL